MPRSIHSHSDIKPNLFKKNLHPTASRISSRNQSANTTTQSQRTEIKQDTETDINLSNPKLTTQKRRRKGLKPCLWKDLEKGNDAPRWFH
jgi:hypothetical protein